MSMSKEEYRKHVEEGIENRFGYYRDKTTEELEEEKEIILKNIEHWISILNDKKASSYQKSEIRNSDLKFEREKLDFVDKVLKERSKRSIR